MPKMITFIVGASFYPGATNRISRLKSGDKLSLVREPNNQYDQYDRNAVAVHNKGGFKLGHVPRQDAPTVAKVMDLGLDIGITSMGATRIDISWGEDLPCVQQLNPSF